MEFKNLNRGTRTSNYSEGYPKAVYDWGEEAGKFTSEHEIANLSINGKEIKITQENQGKLLGDNTMEYNFITDVAYTLKNGVKETSVKFHRAKDERYFEGSDGKNVNYDEVTLSKGSLLNQKKLEQLAQTDNLSETDFLTLSFNLNVRHSMPESIREFKDFSDLQEKMKQAPEVLHDNLVSVLNIMRKADNTDELKEVLYNLRNSDDKKFNLQVRNEIKDIIATQSPYTELGKMAKKVEPLAKTKYLGLNPTKNIFKNSGR